MNPAHTQPEARRRDRWWLGCFFVGAYAVSWAWQIPLALSDDRVAAGTGWPTHFPALLGPAIAALVVTTWRSGRHGLTELGRRMVLVRVPARWWLFALGPLLLLPIVLGIGAVVGRPVPAASDFAVISGVPAGWGVLGVFAVVLVVNGFGEETGWRGYSQQQLQRTCSPLVSTIVVAALWAGWHVPMFFVVDSFRGFDAGTAIGWLIGLFFGSVVLAWLYNRTGGSIALVALWHSSYNMVSGTKAAQGLLAAVMTTLVITLAVILLGLEVRARRRGTASVLGATAERLRHRRRPTRG